MDRTNARRYSAGSVVGARRLRQVATTRRHGREAYDLWRLTVEHSPIAMCLVATDGRMVEPNHAFAAMVGYSLAEVRDLTFAQITLPADLEEDMALFEATLSGEREGYRLTKRFVRVNGEVMWGDLSVVLVRAADGMPMHFISQVLDVTEAHEAHTRLEAAMALVDEERLLLQVILDTVDVGLVMVDRDGGNQRHNRRQLEILRMAGAEGDHTGAGLVGHFYAADGSTPIDEVDMPEPRALRGEEFDDERIWVGPNAASRRALSVSARTVRNSQGEPAGAALAFSDVTELVHALKAREVFEGSISHELRTPLTAVLGHLEMLIDDGELPEATIGQLLVAQRNAVRLRLLVSDLLDPAARTNGTLALVRAPADLMVLARETVETVSETKPALNIILAAHRGDAAPALVDAHRVRQVLDNVISNAVKYTNPGGHVEVHVETEEHDVVVTVTDTGIGMGPEVLTRLWDPFFRAEEARERVTPGVGLGLGIARSIVLAHGGHIDVTSAPGEGSTFRIYFPRL